MSATPVVELVHQRGVTLLAENFWNRSRISRRSALRGIGLGAAGLAGAALIGCGDDDEAAPAAAQSAATAAPAATAAAAQATSEATGEATSILATRRDQNAGAVNGGVFQGITNAEPENLDPLNATSYKAPYSARWAYPTLLQFKPGFITPATGEVQG